MHGHTVPPGQPAERFVANCFARVRRIVAKARVFDTFHGSQSVLVARQMCTSCTAVALTSPSSSILDSSWTSATRHEVSNASRYDCLNTYANYSPASFLSPTTRNTFKLPPAVVFVHFPSFRPPSSCSSSLNWQCLSV
jgi:hypothetical protein